MAHPGKGRRPDQARYDAAVAVVDTPDNVLLPGHDVPLGRYTTVRRLLPQRPRRMVGAWCFVDHFGPDDVAGTPGMRVPPHPHTGLQTVTWLVEGEVLHRDSLGSLATVRPGQLNLMTAGSGIAHSEESPADHPPAIHGLQLWVALPEAARHAGAAFSHHAGVPAVRDGDLTATVVMGEIAGVQSPATAFTPLVGAEVRLGGTVPVRLPLEPDFEHAVLVMTGAAEVAGTALLPGSLLYLGTGRADLPFRSETGGARLFLLGGEPFEEPLVMWWNFVGRSHEEIAAARHDWAAGRRFGQVAGYDGDPLPAPAMPTTRLKARDRHGRTVA
jgi:quercetin 2,3-dioxygenase